MHLHVLKMYPLQILAWKPGSVRQAAGVGAQHINTTDALLHDDDDDDDAQLINTTDALLHDDDGDNGDDDIYIMMQCLSVCL